MDSIWVVINGVLMAINGFLAIYEVFFQINQL